MKTLAANIMLGLKQILRDETWTDNVKLIIFLEEKNEKSPKSAFIR